MEQREKIVKREKRPKNQKTETEPKEYKLEGKENRKEKWTETRIRK